MSTEGTRPRVLVSGPPGAGVPLVVAALQREGLAAHGWEGDGAPPPLPEEPAAAAPELLVALDAGAGACLGRSGAPWSERELSSDSASAVFELERARQALFPARLRASLVLDTGQLSAPLVAARVRQLGPWLGPAPATVPLVVLESFSYPRGVPLDLDWCIDTRALRNPYWEPELRLSSGLEPKVRHFVMGQPLAGEIVAAQLEMLHLQLPELAQHTRRRVLHLALGCTGGFHRSVALAEELGSRLGGDGVTALIWHRDLPDRA